MDFQVSVFGRYSSLFYTPGSTANGNDLGDLLYNGISQTAYKRDTAYGTQDEGAWHLGTHTVRFGVLYEADDLISRTSSLVLPTAPGGVHGARQSQSALHRSDPDLPDLGHAGQHHRQQHQACLERQRLCCRTNGSCSTI